MKRSLFFLAAVLFAQEASFKVESKLVIVNVSVTDKSGNPVTSLEKEEFQIFEDGVRQTISVFDLQQLSNELLAPVSFGTPAAAPTPAPSPARAAAAPENPTRYQDRRLLVLFFDLSSMEQIEQVRAQEAAVKFLSAQMTASDLVSIVTFGNSLKVVQEFTADRQVLLDALRKLNLGEASELAGLAQTAADEGDDSGSFAADETELNIFNTDRKLTALEEAARKLSIYPEKKALVYFASGVGKTGVENQSQLRATVNAAVRANVAFYPIDSRGLVATAPAGDASAASPRGTGVFTASKQGGLRNSFNDSQETLYSLAADTGGKALLDSNDLTLGIRRAQSDINSYYTVGYYSTNPADDGKFRSIRVRLASMPQAKLDYRSGYYAPKVFGKFTAADKERQLEEALSLEDPVSELPLAVEVDYFRIAKDSYFVPISVKIPGSSVGLSKKGSSGAADLDFIGQVRNAAGRLVSGVRDEIAVKLNQADAAQIDRRHLQYDTGLTLPPGAYSLRFLARENLTGKMGTFETGFTVPDLNGEKKLRVSSVVLSSQKEPVSSAVGSAGTSKKLVTEHPLVQDGQKLAPSITRVFRKDQTLYVYFEVYDPSLDPDRKTPRLTAEVELLQGARRAYASPPLRLNKLGTARPGVTPVNFQIPLAKLPAGQYVSQINVIDELGRKFAFPRNPIVVLP